MHDYYDLNASNLRPAWPRKKRKTRLQQELLFWYKRLLQSLGTQPERIYIYLCFLSIHIEATNFDFTPNSVHQNHFGPLSFVCSWILKKTHTRGHKWKVCELRFWFQKSTSIIFLYTRDKFEDLCWGEIRIEHGMEVMSRPLFLSTRKLWKGELSLKFTNSQLNLCICLVCFFYNNFFILSYLRTESISKLIWKWCMKLIDRQARALHVLLTW